MKTLKLDHDLAESVRKGKKTSTWRLYDDKDIRVNDKVELLDKVDPNNPESWVGIGVARIDVVNEKRLGEINESDAIDHGKFASRAAMLKEFQKYYGPQVTYETPVKIIHFSLEKTPAEKPNLPGLKEAKMFADGGSRGNPGPSASGFVITDMDDHVLVKKGVYLGLTTNNQAEYQSLKFGLEEAKRMNIRIVHVYMDSLLVINQMQGIFKVKNRDLWPIYEDIQEMTKTFKHVYFAHVPRELNKMADAAVNEALDLVAKQ